MSSKQQNQKAVNSPAKTNVSKDPEHPSEQPRTPTHPVKVDWDKEGLFDTREADRQKVS